MARCIMLPPSTMLLNTDPVLTTPILLSRFKCASIVPRASADAMGRGIDAGAELDNLFGHLARFVELRLPLFAVGLPLRLLVAKEGGAEGGVGQPDFVLDVAHVDVERVEFLIARPCRRVGRSWTRRPSLPVRRGGGPFWRQ